jgi:hypothetical protein
MFVLPQRDVSPANVLPVMVPCGGCIACRINRQNEWTKRIMDECKFYVSNTFLTLTYSDQNLPLVTNSKTGEVRSTIVKHHFTKFIASLRQSIARSKNPHRISYFTSAEYGPQTNRAHFHSILFGYHPNDANIRRIQRIWAKGFIKALPVLDGGADYCAKHQTKYDGNVPLWVQAPYQTMSNRPAIGLRWILANKDSISYADHMGSYLKFTKNRPVWLPAPRYYMSKTFTPERIKEIHREASRKQFIEARDRYGFSGVKAWQEWRDYNAEIQACDVLWQRKFGNKRRDKV